MLWAERLDVKPKPEDKDRQRSTDEDEETELVLSDMNENMWKTFLFKWMNAQCFGLHTFNHTSIWLFYTLYSHLPHSQQLFNLNPGVWLWTARTSVRLPALVTTWTHLHYSVHIHPKNSLATEFPAFCHGVQSAPNKKSPLNKTGKKGFSCINNNNNNNHNNDKKKKWKRIQMDSLRLEEQFRNCNCGVDDVTHEKLNK